MMASTSPPIPSCDLLGDDGLDGDSSLREENNKLFMAFKLVLATAAKATGCVEEGIVGAARWLDLLWQGRVFRRRYSSACKYREVVEIFGQVSK